MVRAGKEIEVVDCAKFAALLVHLSGDGRRTAISLSWRLNFRMRRIVRIGTDSVY
jgi:hypothetical protein